MHNPAPIVTAQDADWLASHLRTMVSTHPSTWSSSELTLPQLTALHFISAAAPVTLMWLSEALGTRPPATCAMVDRLTRAGLVHRTPDPRDRRRVQLAVTRYAVPMLGQVDLPTAQRLQTVLNSMSGSARRCLAEVLRDTARRLAR
ncbi:MAG TPA: helix-turn-helix domain-containing protein [Pseudonocardiaceae bacterium]